MWTRSWSPRQECGAWPAPCPASLRDTLKRHCLTSVMSQYQIVEL
jgi:hypothetical protein